jgi:hypothetical protein
MDFVVRLCGGIPAEGKRNTYFGYLEQGFLLLVPKGERLQWHLLHWKEWKSLSTTKWRDMNLLHMEITGIISPYGRQSWSVKSFVGFAILEVAHLQNVDVEKSCILRKGL